MDTEEYFPRGKLENAPEIKPPTTHINFLLNTSKRKSSNFEHPNVKKRRVDKLKEFIEDIGYRTVEEGMTILACIRSVTALSIEVELPGRMAGKINITSISDPLTKLLEQESLNESAIDASIQLDKMFYVGQFIPVKVLTKSNSKKGTILSLSMKPSDVSKCDNFKKGHIVWAAVESRQDHGYQLNVGGDRCRIFLPNKNISPGTTYVVGQCLWCVIRKSTIASEVTTLVVGGLDSSTVLNEDMGLFNLVPGTPVQFTISKVVRCGLMGMFLENAKGCVHESFLKTPLQNLEDYSVGDQLKGYLLYVHPITKLAYFSLRPTRSVVRKYENGAVLNCRVTKTINLGVYLQLDDAVGFVARKRFSAVEAGDDLRQKCRVLDYRHLEQIYICTFDTDSEIKEEDNYEIGQLVDVLVSNVGKEGVSVKLGRIKGFIPNMHLSDEPYDEDIKATFKIGDTISAKVWCIRESIVHFTCKEMLLDMDTPAVSLENIQVKRQYPGVVVNKGRSGILVVFFGDVRGMLFKHYLNKIFGNESYKAFYEGEVVVPVIDKVENNLLRLKFNVSEARQVIRPFHIGEYVSATVTKHTSKGLIVSIPSKSQTGFVPTSHLSSNLCLTSSLLKTYNVGDNLDDLMCVCTRPTILSLREGRRFKSRNAQVPKLSDLSVGSLIRCSYLKSDDARIKVACLLAPKTTVSYLYNKDLDPNMIRKFVYQQSIVGKVTRLDIEKKQIRISARFNDKLNFEEALDNLAEYLQDIRRIQQCLSKVTKCQLGEKVDCTIKTIRKDYATVTLEDDTKGIVTKGHCLDNLKLGDKVKGIVLWVDVERNLAVISLKMKNEITFKYESDPFANTTVKGTVSYFNDELLVATTDDNCAIFVPNLSKKQLTQYIPMQEISVITKRFINGMLIGMDKTILPKVNNSLPRKDKKQLVRPDNPKIDRESKCGKETILANDCPKSKVVASLPGVEDFFAAPPPVETENSSDEDKPPERKLKRKKKKLTAVERTELIRQTEEKIRAKEIQLADSTFEPETEEHFERLVAGNPNSSELWAKYIAYCVSNAEIPKARSVARSALRRIDLTHTEERYNVWITLLNLENSYGDKDSFNAVFEEAVRCNDDLQIYLDVIDLFSNSEKYMEMNEKIKKVKGKHKTNPKMWTSIARTYYKCGHLQDARNVHNSTLKSVQSKSDHVDLVVQFAIMEFNYGEKHHAEALFETVLQSNPKRVDVWSTYVDQMVKNDNIDGARRVLDRAVCQTIPPKKMKILFKKYKDLELKVGNEEGVQYVVDLARKYLGNKLQ